MKKIINIVVAVVTCFCVLACTTMSAFAESVKTGVDSEGYTFHIDDNGNVYYDYPIEMHNVYSYELLKSISLFTITPIDGTSAYEVVYNTSKIIPFVAKDVAQGAVATGGAAAGGGTAAGAAATIAGLSAGQVVLLAALFATGIVIATEPELVETVINDISHYIDHQTMLKLGETYFQETWLLDEEIIGSINKALSQSVTISDGVIWIDSLAISLGDFTGLTETFPEKPVVVETQPEDALTIEYFELERNVWTSTDTSGTIAYKQGPAGRWSNDGLKYTTSSSSSAGWQHEISVLNTSTGASATFYRQNTDGSHGAPGSATADRWFIGNPVFIDDGTKTGVEIVIGHKSNRSTFYDFTSVTSTTDSAFSHQYPLILRHTGSILDDKLITKVSYNDETGKWKYTYKEQGDNESVPKKTVELPMEPFKWIFTQSQPSTSQDNSSALKTQTSPQQEVDDMGKIQFKPGSIEVPQIKGDKIEIPKLKTEPLTESDPDADPNPDADPDADRKPEKNIVPDGLSNPNNNPNNNPNPDPDPDPDPDYDTDPDNPDNPDKEKWSKWVTGIFELEHLFDWLPESYASRFDVVIKLVGSIILTLLLTTIIKRFFV